VVDTFQPLRKRGGRKKDAIKKKKRAERAPALLAYNTDLRRFAERKGLKAEKRKRKKEERKIPGRSALFQAFELT